ncbi:response regulator [Halobacteriovorax sp. GB3]|uniref:response regulator n=1 Tax=Halobacteriovorax sp. GB3 TaxID=2719615 RepID=UPI002360E3C6|nr:response regulator [Halobacteriovorax sp. GB3]MDD0853496.1 response regulator [Halobacteriovorax sp. GB3]
MENSFLRRPNILLIDDSVDMLNLMKVYINKGKLGDSHVFKNEFHALNFLSGAKVDLVVIDIYLASINGFKIGKILREILNSNVPIIYISSSNNGLQDFYKEDQRNTYFMKKPFDQKTFNDVVKSMMGIAA